MQLRFKKLRLWLVYPFFIIYSCLAADLTQRSFLYGVSCMLLGMGLRFWASGHLVKTDALTTSGPYRYLRDPLYLGNFLLGLGISLIPNNIWLLVFYFVIFTLSYVPAVLEEKEALLKKFGQEYGAYARSVPAFWPALKAYKKTEGKKFNIHLSFESGEFMRICGFSAAIVFFYLWRTFVLEGRLLLWEHQFSLFLLVAFLFLVWFNIHKRRSLLVGRRGRQRPL